MSNTDVSIDYWFLRKNGVHYKTVLGILDIAYKDKGNATKI